MSLWRLSKLAQLLVVSGLLASLVLVGLAVSTMSSSPAAPQEAGPSPQMSPASRGKPVIAPEVVARIRSDQIPRHLVPQAAQIFTSPALDAVVEGTVTAVDYRYVDGIFPATRMTVRVDRSQGDVPRQVTVWESGGLIPVDQVPAEDRQKMGVSERELTSRAVIDFQGSGKAAHPATGERYLFFLWRNPNGGEMAESYYELGDSFGRFAPDSQGNYQRVGVERGVDRWLSGSRVDAQLSK